MQYQRAFLFGPFSLIISSGREQWSLFIVYSKRSLDFCV